MNEQMKKGMSEMNEWKKRMSDWTKEMYEWMNKLKKKRIVERMNKGRNEQKNEWIN